jgi:hypothetical protein
MKTTDLFKINRTSKRLNESMFKTFGRKLNLETFNIEQLEDARNKLRTQIYTARSSSSFNETVENDALSQAQFMHDAIVAELSERDEPIVDNTVQEGRSPEVEEFLTKVAQSGDDGFDMLYGAQAGKYGKEIEQAVQEMYDDITIDTGYHGDDDFEQIYDRMLDNIESDYGDREESVQTELSTNTLKSYQDKAGKDIVNTMTSGDYMTTDKSAKKVMNRMKGSEKADNKIYKRENESIEQTGDNMSNLREGEIQQASAIVTAKTMVDRVGRWIEELSGMENDTLLQLGDSIRDEMGQEQAKGFIEAVAPAIQSALENLKTTREALASGVRTLTGEEQPANMLGGEPAADMAAEPDAMNTDAELGGDEFAAAEPAAGGAEEAGREMRESINHQNRLMRALAG